MQIQMSDCFNSKLCDKSSKNKSKKRHSNSQNLEAFTKSIISRYSISNPTFADVEDVLKKNC